MLELLFLVGVCFAVREAWNTVGPAVGQARSTARTNATKRGGNYNRDGVRRRAARQATIGWWSRELRHRFPVTRAGLRHGWELHQNAARDAERKAAKRDATHATRWAGWRQEIEAHWKRMDDARQRTAAKGTPAKPAPAAKPARPLTAVPDLPPAGGTTPLVAEPAAPTGGAPTQPTGGPPVAGSGDINYDEALSTCDKLVDAAEQAVSSGELAKASQLADALGGMLRKDPETMGQAGEVASAVAAVWQSAARLQESAAALKTRVERTYGPTVEAVDASGVGAPEPEFVEH